MAAATVSPAARRSVNPEIRWIEKSMPSPRTITDSMEVTMFNWPTTIAALPRAHKTPNMRLIMAKSGATHILKETISRSKMAIKAITVVYPRLLSE